MKMVGNTWLIMEKEIKQPLYINYLQKNHLQHTHTHTHK